MKLNRNYSLSTPEIDLLKKENPLNEYPHPQFQRESYLSLNGYWDLCISKDPNERNFNNKILVPYCIESLNSGLQKEINNGEYLIYKKDILIKKSFLKDKTFICFDGIDQEFTLIVNGTLYPHKTTLNVPCKIDITDTINEGNNSFIIICYDDLKQHLPHGKQTRISKGMFYTSVSGIYFPVYLESVSNDYIESFKLNTSLNDISLNIKTTAKKYSIEIYDEGKLIHKDEYIDKSITIPIDNPHLWSREDPHLYDLIIKTKNDIVKSYFGLRTIQMIDGFVYLNNEKIFLNGLLDQGYYPEGIYTVSDYSSYENDILTMKKLGFNTLRKHIKIESDYFYYLCDKHGMLVIQDFVNNSKYNFLFDTALPTIGFQTISDKNLHKSLLSKINFLRHSRLVMNYLYNHPCIICYTIFNEGWGQFKADKMYEIIKKRDPSRLYDSTSGWFRQNKSDFESLHIYFKDISKNISKFNKPVFISEFGGFVYKIKEHSFNVDKTYGYKFYNSRNEFEQGLIELYENHIVKNKDKIVGCIYTQVSDVEDETNGLFTYDRKILKVDEEIIYNTMKKLQ